MNDSERANAYLERGNARATAGDLNGAITDYNIVLQMIPESAMAYECRAAVREQLGDRVGALADYAQARRYAKTKTLDTKPMTVLDQANAQMSCLQGEACLDQGDYQGALKHFNAALRADAELGNAFFGRAQARYLLDGDIDGAIDDLSEAIYINPKHAAAYVWRGQLNIVRRKEELALTDLNQALRLNAKNAEAYFFRGMALDRSGHYQAALVDYGQAIHLYNHAPEMYAERAATRMTLHDAKGALDDMNHAIRLNGSSACYFNMRGAVRRYLGDRAGSENDFRRATELDPECPSPRLYDALATRR
jgi:tetratricopeptide (TPR) repeat protein